MCNKTTIYDGDSDTGFKSRIHQQVSRCRDDISSFKSPRQVVTNNNIVSKSDIAKPFFESIL